MPVESEGALYPNSLFPILHQSRPPSHLLIARHHLPDPLHIQALLPLVLEIASPLKQAAIQAQIRILKQLLLQKRTQRTGPCDAPLRQHIRPWLQDILIQIINDMLQIQLGKLADERPLKARFNPKDLRYNARQRSLRRTPSIHDIEHSRPSHRAIVASPTTSTAYQAGPSTRTYPTTLHNASILTP